MESANLTRRTFLAGGFVAATVAVTGCASPLHDKTALHSSSAFIDTHTHFYDPSRPQGVPWPSKGDAVLYRTVLPAEYKRFAEALGVGGTVVVEASPWLEDNQFILDLAMDEPFILGLCGNLPPGENSFKQHLSRFTKNPLFRGIRISGDGWRSKVGEGTI